MTVDILKDHRDSNGVFWWHSIRLADGSVTPGAKPLDILETEMQEVFLATGTIGKTILDVGAFNGAWTIGALRRGAHRAVALDYPVWRDENFRGRQSIEFALKRCNLSAELVECDLDKAKLNLSYLGNFDIVLALGIFYCLINPLAAFRELCKLATEKIVIEIYISEPIGINPLMLFDPKNPYGVHWKFNEQMIVKLLDHCGFDHKIINKNGQHNRVTIMGIRR